MVEWVVISALAVWRAAMLLVYDDVFEGMRQRLGAYEFDVDTGRPLSFTGWVLSCFWCCSLLLSMPIGIILALCLGSCAGMVLFPLAISGLSILLHYMVRMHLIIGGGNG